MKRIQLQGLAYTDAADSEVSPAEANAQAPQIDGFQLQGLMYRTRGLHGHTGTATTAAEG